MVNPYPANVEKMVSS